MSLRSQFRAFERILNSGVITKWGLAIDGGANAGNWTAEMAKRFEVVHAFEPQRRLFRGLAKRFADEPHVVLHNKALLDRSALVEVVLPDGRTKIGFVRPAPLGKTVAVTIDSMAFPACDFIKLDVEGAEQLAVAGSVQTINRFKPVMMIEDLAASWYVGRYGKSELSLKDQMAALGYKVWLETFPDVVFVP